MSVTILETDFHRIISCMGYPAIPLDLLEYTETDIKNLFIGDALEYYFSRFPLKETTAIQTSSDFNIDFPSADVFGITDARVNRSGRGANNITGNPFRDEALVNAKYSSRSNLGINSFKGLPPVEALTNETQRQVSQAGINKLTSQRIKCEVENRAVKGYLNGTGELSITWAKTSEDFADVPMKDKQNVMWFAQSIILKRFAILRDQANTGQGVDFNTSSLHSEADRLDSKVMSKWNKRRAVVVIRG